MLAMVAILSTRQVAAFSTKDVAVLTTAQIGALSTDQAAALHHGADGRADHRPGGELTHGRCGGPLDRPRSPPSRRPTSPARPLKRPITTGDVAALTKPRVARADHGADRRVVDRSGGGSVHGADRRADHRPDRGPALSTANRGDPFGRVTGGVQHQGLCGAGRRRRSARSRRVMSRRCRPRTWWL